MPTHTAVTAAGPQSPTTTSSDAAHSTPRQEDGYTDDDRALSVAGSATASEMERSQRNRREEILLLRKSLPSRTELLRIMDTHPQEGERLVRFCAGIKAKIEELEAEYQAAVRDLDERRREEARRRAAAVEQERQQAVVGRFMGKVLASEDRAAAAERERRRAAEEKAAVEYVRAQEAEEERRAAEAERVRRLEAKGSTWNRAVAAVEQARERQRAGAQARRAEESQAQAQRRRDEERRAAAERARLRELAQSLEDSAAAHRRKHEERLRERQAAAGKLAAARVAHPDAESRRRERSVRRLQEGESKLQRSQEQHHAALQEVSVHVRERRETRAQGAQQRVAARRQAEQRKAAEADAALKARLERHSQRLEERRLEAEERARSKAARQGQCQRAVGDRQEERHAEMAQKLMDRTLRIGSALGVELPPILPPSTLYTTAAPIPAERRKARPARSGSAELTFQPNVGRVSIFQSKRELPPRCESAPPGIASSSAVAVKPSGEKSLLLVADTLAPPASLLRLAASIVAERIEDSQESQEISHAPDAPPHVQQLVAAAVSNARQSS